MINVSDYWTLPPLYQMMTRTEVTHFERELQRVVGYYCICLKTYEHIEFTLFCSKCYNAQKWRLYEEYTPITKEEYLNKNHDMHGETCEKCSKALA